MNIFSLKYKNLFLISTILLSFGMHYRHLDKELMSVHVWRQTQTQSTINNFYEEDFNILNPRKNDRGNTEGFYRMEFPLMQWLVAGLYKIFGSHLMITRVFMFIIGIFSVTGMYKLLTAIFYQPVAGLLGAYAFTFSPCFFYYTINPLPDNMALMASIWGLAAFFSWKRTGRGWVLLLSGIMLSVGTLCKLPFVLFYIVPGIYFLNQLLKPTKNKLTIIGQQFYITTPILLPVIWYISVIPGWHGNGVTSGIMDNQISMISMLDIFQHNLVSTLPELLLNYGSVPFFIAGFYYFFKERLASRKDFILLLALSLGLSAYFIFEINMIAKVHDYYLFPFFPILFILVGFGAYKMLQEKSKWIVYFAWLLLVSLPIFTEVRMLSRWNPENPGVNKDLFNHKNELRNAVPKDALCVVGNDISHFIMLYYVDKKGWCFHDSKPDLTNMINQGAEYLYLDVSKIEDMNYFTPFIDSTIIKKGSIHVYQLADKP